MTLGAEQIAFSVDFIPISAQQLEPDGPNRALAFEGRMQLPRGGRTEGAGACRARSHRWLPPARHRGVVPAGQTLLIYTVILYIYR